MSKVFTSSIIPAALDKVWGKISDFNVLPDWHPVVADCYIENDKASDCVGCIRNFNLHDNGGNIRERLLALDDEKYYFTYCILESPMKVENYIATLSLLPITDGNQTYAEWTAQFDCDVNDEAELIEFIGNGVFQSGFNVLKVHFSNR